MPRRPPLVSVIIPLHEGRRWLAEAIESALLRQTDRDVEVIIVDDGSRDGGADVARGYDVRLVAQENAGVAAARNRGLAEARGELVVFLDQDDRLLPRALEVGAAALAAEPSLGWVVGHVRSIDAQGAPRPHAPPRPSRGLDYVSMLRGQAACGGTPGRAMFRRQLLRAVGGFDPRHAPADDNDLFLRVAARAPGRWVDEPVIEYRRHAGNASNAVARMLRATLGVLDAHAAASRDPVVHAACAAGRAHWRQVFGPRLVPELRHALRHGDLRRATSAALGTVGCLVAAARDLVLRPAA